MLGPPAPAPRPHPVRRTLAWGAVPLVAACLAAWEGTVTRSSAAAHWSVGATIAAIALACIAGGRGRQRSRSAEWIRAGASAVWRTVSGHGARPALAVAAGTALWVLLAVATIGWDLNSFLHQAHSLPTLSGLVGDVTRHDWGRSLVFAAWLALGAHVALGWRRSATKREGERRGARSR